MRKRFAARWSVVILLLPTVALIAPSALSARQAADQPVQKAARAEVRPPVHARPVGRLLIRNAMVIYGNAKPAFGPVDILVQDGLIARVGSARPTDPAPDAVIDATGKYVTPGIVNTHMHLQDERGGVPQPFQYEMNLYLAAGATTVRDVGSDFEKAKKWRAESAAHTLIAPRILLYERIWAAKGAATP